MIEDMLFFSIRSLNLSFFLTSHRKRMFCSPYFEKKKNAIKNNSHLSCLTAFNTEKTKQGKLWTTYYSLLLIFFTTPVRW